MANAFSKEEIVFFEDLIIGFQPNNITARQVSKYQPPATQFERAALTTHRPLPYLSIDKDGLVLAPGDFADMTQMTVPSTLNVNPGVPSDIKNVPFNMNAVELNDPLQRDRKLKSALQRLSALVDSTVARRIANYGTLFVKESGEISLYRQVARCEEEQTIRDQPMMDARTLIMNATDYNNVSDNLAKRDAPPTGVSLTAFERSQIPPIATFDSFKANFLPTVIAAAGTGYLVDGPQFAVPTALDANGNNTDPRTMLLTVKDGANTVKLGDSFNIAGVNALSAVHKNDTGKSQTFKVIAENSSTEWEVSPSIFTNHASGGSSQAEKEYANCSIAAPDSAQITFLNTTTAPSNIFFINEAVEIIHGSLATMDLDGSGVSTMRESTDSGIELLFAKGSEIEDLGTKYRLVMWMNANVLVPEMCGQLLGNQA